ncbi:ABC transporter permease [Ruthenibacterium lactatiformans]|uniref:ABC transporter permease n=1 Tax=Ruthenibacterium lactatiformans TaxID=1550024 RepID=UPI00307FE6B9
MTRYLLKRVGQTLIIVVLVSFCTFMLVNLMPKDPVYALFGSDISQEEYDAAFHNMGLDKPLLYRYFLWAKDFITGNFGTSYRYHLPVTELIGQKVGITLYLSVLSTLISFPLGMLLGVITAVKRGKWQDTVLTLMANLTASLPGFVIAIVLLYVFCIKLKVLPSTGFTFPWQDFGKHIRQLILPLFCLSLGGIAGICRQTRSSMLEAIRQDYVRTARSKGLKENYIIKTHVLRNGLIPIITMIGGRLAHMIGGSVFIENVFSIPGMGTLMVQAVNDVDVPVMQACVMLSALVISLAYLVTDFLYVAVDPRISLQ